MAFNRRAYENVKTVFGDSHRHKMWGADEQSLWENFRDMINISYGAGSLSAAVRRCAVADS